MAGRRYRTTMEPWYLYTLQWYRGKMVPWYLNGTMGPWDHGTMLIIACNGVMISRHNGTMLLCYQGTKLPFYYQYTWTIAPRYHSTMVPWSSKNGTKLVPYCQPMVPSCTMVPWYHAWNLVNPCTYSTMGTMVPWYYRPYRTMLPWNHGNMVAGYHSTLVPWYHGTRVPSHHDSMVPWYHCSMVP